MGSLSNPRHARTMKYACCLHHQHQIIYDSFKLFCNLNNCQIQGVIVSLWLLKCKKALYSNKYVKNEDSSLDTNLSQEANQSQFIAHRHRAKTDDIQ